MLTRNLLIAGVLAAVAMLTACTGQTPPATNTVIVPERITSESVKPTASAAPVTDSSRTAEPPLESAGGPSNAEGVPAAGAEAPTPSPNAGQVSTPSGTQTATPSAGASAEDFATMTQMVEVYWGAFNAYDADLALSMLEENYRADEEELIRRDIGRMKLFRATLEVSEEKPLALNEAGDYEIYLKLATPVDTRRVKMVFRRIEGQWRIVFSDEVK